MDTVFLVKITQSNGETLRLVNHYKDISFNGETYIAYPMQITLTKAGNAEISAPDPYGLIKFADGSRVQISAATLDGEIIATHPSFLMKYKEPGVASLINAKRSDSRQSE